MAEGPSLRSKAPPGKESNISKSSIATASTQTGLKLTRRGINRLSSAGHATGRGTKRSLSTSTLNSGSAATQLDPSLEPSSPLVQNRKPKASKPAPAKEVKASLLQQVAAKIGVISRRKQVPAEAEPSLANLAVENEPRVCPPGQQPREPPQPLPPGVSIAVKGTAEHARVAELLSEELSGKGALLPFQYFICNLAVTKEAQSKKPRLVRVVPIGNDKTKEHYYWSQDTVNGLYPVQAPAAVFEKTPAGDYQLLFAVIDNACGDAKIARILEKVMRRWWT